MGLSCHSICQINLFWTLPFFFFIPKYPSRPAYKYRYFYRFKLIGSISTFAFPFFTYQFIF